MLYPRQDNKGKLVSCDQMVEYREHMTQKHRVLFVSGVMTGETESHNLLMALDSINHDPIKLFITSPGGDLDSAFLFIDTIRLLQSPVITIGRYCASAASLLLTSGSQRYLLPHAKVMLHLPSGVLGGDAKDWEIAHKEMDKYKNAVADIYIENGAKRTRTELFQDMDRDFWLDSEEAIAYGLADEVLSKDKLASWLTPS